MGVTVRTLQYYDKEGVLSPSTQSDGGRRLYTDKDIVKLYRVLSFKQLGFSLSDIKGQLSSIETPDGVSIALTQQAKLTMIAQLVFLPSILLSGIMFPANMLPKALETVGKIFPASWGYRLMLDSGFEVNNLLCLSVILIISVIACGLLLKKQQSQ